MTAFAVTLAVGITILFAGFLVASAAGAGPRQARRWLESVAA
jgi:hypothetical protein